MSEWIRVEDELPRCGDPVIAACRDYRVDGLPPAVVPARFNLDREEWFDVDNLDSDGDEVRLFRVTHWMPLPEPPK